MKPETNREPVLDDALVEQLNEALAEDAEAPFGEAPLDAETQARIKQRVLRRIASANTPRHTTQQAEDGWQPFGAGVRIKVLHEADGIMSYLLRLAPGASLPAHRHPVDEGMRGAGRRGADRQPARGRRWLPPGPARRAAPTGCKVPKAR